MAITYLHNIDLSKNQFLNAVLQHVAGNHGDLGEGLIWYDSSGKVVKFYNGTSVQTLGVAGSGGDADTLDGNDSVYYLSRTNHTGTQAASTISNLATTVKAYRLDEFAVPTIALALNAQKITGLANGTVSTDAAAFGQIGAAVAGLASTSYVDSAIAALADSAPATLDTLNELAAALGDDPNFAATVNTALGLRTKKYSALIGNASATAFNITQATHGLAGNAQMVCQVLDATSGNEVYPEKSINNSNGTVTITFATAPSTNSYRVNIIG